MGLHADGHAESLGGRGRRLKHPRRCLQLSPAARAVARELPAENADQRRLPVAGQLQELAQFGAGVLAGEPDGGVDRHGRQAGRGESPLYPRAGPGEHRWVDQLAIDKP